MITRVSSDRMVVISDLHIGNPSCTNRDAIMAFMEWSAERGYDLCINGDGIDFSHLSQHHLARQAPDLLRLLRLVAQKGRRVFYVVGNHDLLLESYVVEGSVLSVVPFLTVESGETRVHIEHGHLHDPVFMRNPALYEKLVNLGGTLVRLSPRAYKAVAKVERRIFATVHKRHASGIPGEPATFYAAASELADRGFDVVIFGHTHRRGEVDLGEGRRYINPGSWLLDSSFVAIEQGRVELRRWEPTGLGDQRGSDSVNVVP